MMTLNFPPENLNVENPPPPSMVPEAVLNLFDSSWFYLSPISEPNPNPQISQTPSKLHVPRPLTIRARSKSDQVQITNHGTDAEREIDLVGTPRKKKRFSKSLSELEFVEMKGFMDLGFVFSEEDKKDSELMEIVPGLQKLGLEMGRGAEEMCGPRTRPYLSEAWEVESLARKWGLPDVANEIHMKDSLKWWAHSVASAVR